MKYWSTNSWLEPDGLESLSAGVRADDRDAHLRHDLEHALAERLDEVLDGLLGRDAGDHARADEVLGGLHRQVRVDRGCPVADQQRDVVHLAHVARLDDEPDLHAVLVADEVVVHGREHEQRRDRREVLVRVAVGQDDELRAVVDRLVDLVAHLGEALLHAPSGPCRRGRARGSSSTSELPRVPIDVLDLRELVVVDHREVERRPAARAPASP